MVKNRNIVMCIILSIITCGIYGIIWMINMANDLNTVSKEQDTSGGMVFVFSLITCGIYGLFWIYKAGRKLDIAATTHGYPAKNQSVLFLILSIVGLGIIPYCLIQNELNSYAA